MSCHVSCAGILILCADMWLQQPRSVHSELRLHVDLTAWTTWLLWALVEAEHVKKCRGAACSFLGWGWKLFSNLWTSHCYLNSLLSMCCSRTMWINMLVHQSSVKTEELWGFVWEPWISLISTYVPGTGACFHFWPMDFAEFRRACNLLPCCFRAPKWSQLEDDNVLVKFIMRRQWILGDIVNRGPVCTWDVISLGIMVCYFRSDGYVFLGSNEWYAKVPRSIFSPIFSPWTTLTGLRFFPGIYLRRICLQAQESLM